MKNPNGIVKRDFKFTGLVDLSHKGNGASYANNGTVFADAGECDAVI